jgi:hypothetical protein
LRAVGIVKPLDGEQIREFLLDGGIERGEEATLRDDDVDEAFDSAGCLQGGGGGGRRGRGRGGSRFTSLLLRPLLLPRNLLLVFFALFLFNKLGDTVHIVKPKLLFAHPSAEYHLARSQSMGLRQDFKRDAVVARAVLHERDRQRLAIVFEETQRDSERDRGVRERRRRE